MRVNGKATVQIGATVLTASDTDEPDPDAVQLVDGLALMDQLGDDQLWPMQPTASITFGVYAPTVDDLPSFADGDGVRVSYVTPRTGAVERVEEDFTLTDVSLRPHPVGVLAELTAVDRLVGEFSEIVVGDVPWPAEATSARIARIVNLAGYAYGGESWPSTWLGDTAGVRARDVDAQPALGLLTTLLRGWTLEQVTFGTPSGRLYGTRLVPDIDPGTLVVTGWSVEHVASFDASTDLPADFGDDPEAGGYGVVMDTGSAFRSDQLVSADYVDLSGARFTRRKGVLANAVTVSGFFGVAGAEASVTARNGVTPEVSYTLATELTAQADAERAAATYLPDNTGVAEWLADTFTWRWYAEPDTTDRLGLPQVGDLVTVAPVQLRHNPTGRPWYAGILVARVFKLSKAQPVLDLTIRPQTRAIKSVGALTWDDLPAGVTWDQLNSRDTWDDYQLLRD